MVKSKKAITVTRLAEIMFMATLLLITRKAFRLPLRVQVPQGVEGPLRFLEEDSRSRSGKLGFAIIRHPQYSDFIRVIGSV